MVKLTEAYAINWTAVVLIGVVGFGAVLGMFITSRIIAPRKWSASKDSPYECGIPASPFSWSQIQIKYYVFAIFFVIFDVEAVFLFPWALVFMKAVPAAVFYEMIIFIAILFFGILYGWKKGVLQWR